MSFEASFPLNRLDKCPVGELLSWLPLESMPFKSSFPLNRLDKYAFGELLSWLPLKCILKLRQTGDVALCRLLQTPCIVNRVTIEPWCENNLIGVCPPKQEEKGKAVARDPHLLDLSHVTHICISNHNLRVSQDVYARVASLIASFQHLTHFSCNLSGDPTLLFPSLPAHLRYLDMKIDIRLMANLLKALPHLIEYLSLEIVSENLVFDFSEVDFTDLPPSLTTFICRTWDNGHTAVISQLPQSLKCLELRSIKYNELEDGKLDDVTTMAKLPPNLLHLSFTGDDQLSDGAIHALPRSLRYLSIFWNQSITNDGIAALPLNLTFLSVSSNRKITSKCFGHLPSQLTYLDVSSATLVTDDDMAYLPRTLTHLDMYSSSSSMGNDGIAHLPRKLRRLSIARASEITDACIKFLPRSLEHLDISGAYLLTYDCFQDMPPRITRLIRPHQFRTYKEFTFPPSLQNGFTKGGYL